MTAKKSDASVPEFLDRRAAAIYIGLSDFWLAKHKSNPDAPRFVKYGRKCWYRRKDLDAWLKERKERVDGEQDLWVQSSARQTGIPDAAGLAEQYERQHGTEPATVIVARAVDRVRRLTPAKLKVLINTLDLIDEGVSG